MDEATRESYIALLSWTGAHTQGLGTLLREQGSPEALLAALGGQPAEDPCDEQEAPGELRPALWRALHSARRQWPRRNPRSRPLKLAGDESFITLFDQDYPAALRQIPDPPPWLFCRGDPTCLAGPSVAIVGSRRASHAGLRAAHGIAERLAQAGITVCSGLALGIDAAAHRGALLGGRTCAVLASGIDRPSPLRHRALAGEIRAAGCLLSELPPGTPPSKMQFPRRNRIISGLAEATIIVEAAFPSGSLHTAASALEQGRDVYTLPWSIFHAQGAGCLRLLRDGATPIISLEELAAHFPQLQARVIRADGETGGDPPPDGNAARILRLLGDEGLSLEQLCSHTGLMPAALLALLGEMEISGLLRRHDGLYLRAECKSCQPPVSC